jgi:hypothetical protein
MGDCASVRLSPRGPGRGYFRAPGRAPPWVRVGRGISGSHRARAGLCRIPQTQVGPVCARRKSRSQTRRDRRRAASRDAHARRVDRRHPRRASVRLRRVSAGRSSPMSPEHLDARHSSAGSLAKRCTRSRSAARTRSSRSRTTAWSSPPRNRPLASRYRSSGFQDALDRLLRDGEIVIRPSSTGYRGAFIGAVLACRLNHCDERGSDDPSVSARTHDPERDYRDKRNEGLRRDRLHACRT